MLYDFCYLFVLFIFYSFLGYITEIIACSIHTKKLVLNRGFLMGPYLPIYGISCILMYFFLEKYDHDLIALFVMSAVVCSITEFFTSYILEKIFKIRWWDYSQLKFNLDGRICLSNSLLFGLGGVALIRIINPLIIPILNQLEHHISITIAFILMAIFLADLTTSIVTLCKIKISSNKYSKHDATEEIRKLINDTLKKNSFLFTRLLNAFPKMAGKNKEKIVKLKKIANEFRQKVKENKEKLKEEYHNKRKKEN